MKKKQAIEKYKELGEKWMNGYDIESYSIGDNDYEFLPSQKKFINAKDRYCLCSGGLGSGKSLALYIKLILMALMFPKNKILLGRKHISTLQKNTLPELLDLMPTPWYEHHVKANTIDLFNGSQILMFGLDAMQGGSQKDIKKANQELKSLNLGAFFIDQLEEIDKSTFKALQGRIRRKEIPINQGNMTCNPANFWAYDYFKKNPKPNTFLVEASMIENKEHLPADYIEDKMQNSDRYVKRYVEGKWDMDVLTDNVVIAKEYIDQFREMTEEPKEIIEGCEIYEYPRDDIKYQMGVDPSEGSVDPSAISVVGQDGKKVAKFSGYISIPELAEKVKFLYYKYNKALIIPEVNAIGMGLLQEIKNLKVYYRKHFDYKERKQTKKIGFKTTSSSKASLISHFQDLLRKGYPKIYDEDTVEEMQTFVWNDMAAQKGASAEPNCHDDNIMATMLSYWDLDPEKVQKREQRKSRNKFKSFQFQYR